LLNLDKEVLEIMHDVIGCTDVCRKPNLLYKLASAPLKADPITLGSVEDWRGCQGTPVALPARDAKAALNGVTVG
jgi:hypothetical protein